MNLHTLILEKLSKTPLLSFAEFMQLALYDPLYGYYTMGMQCFGQDFTTAPQISPLFGACIAQQGAEILKKVSQPVILEFGAGSGRLCIDVLRQLEKLECLPETYFILELSGRLQSQQRQQIEQEIPHLLARIQWLTSFPTVPFQGLILANEVVDAMPVHRFLRSKEALYEIYVSLNAEGALCEVLKVCDNVRLQEHVQQILKAEYYPYLSEVNLCVADWLQQCASVLSRGLMLVIDYGFPASEYYHPDRHQGTLMCHYRHRSHTNPFIHLGEQDMTAHVDFTHVAESSLTAGFHVSGFNSQASFLLSTGLLSLVQTNDPNMLFNQQNAIKLLTHPNEMGELFKVMALSKDWDEPLSGFQLQDRRASL